MDTVVVLIQIKTYHYLFVKRTKDILGNNFFFSLPHVGFDIFDYKLNELYQIPI